MKVEVECQKRPEKSKPRALRREGLIPAVLYGHNGTESVALTIKHKEAQILLKKAAINNTLVDLNVPDLPWNGKVIIREVQAHPWKRNIFHLSFFSPSRKSLEILIPITLVGESIGAKQGGIIEQQTTELKALCKPTNIPESIEVDITNLNLGDSFIVEQLVLPEGVEVIDDPNTNIASVVAPRKVAESTQTSDGSSETTASLE